MDDLNDKRVNNNEPSGNLLAPQEKLILEQIAAGGTPHNQRAQSLLAINAGVTQTQAALQSGQSVGQVSYWLSKFRREGMSIFPEELVRQTEIEPPPPLQLPAQHTPLEGSEIDHQPDRDMSGDDSISPAEEDKSDEVVTSKKKSKKGKASKKKKKEMKSSAAKGKTKKETKTKKKLKKDKTSKKKGKRSRRRTPRSEMKKVSGNNPAESPTGGRE